MNRKMKLWIILISLFCLFPGYQGMLSSAMADEGTLQGFILSSNNSSRTPWDPEPWNLNTYSLFTGSFTGEHTLTLMGTTTILQQVNDMEYWTHLPVSPPSDANGEIVTIAYGTNTVSGRIPSVQSSEEYPGIIEMPVSYNLHVSGGTRTYPIISWTNDFNSLFPGFAPIDQYRIRVFDMDDAQVFFHKIRSDEIDLWGSNQSFDFSMVGFSLADSQYRILIEARKYVDMLDTAGAGNLEYFLVNNSSSADMDYYTDSDSRTVYGRVLDAEGNPVPGLWVHAFDKACGGNWVGGGRTDNEGYYAIYGISTTDVYVQACANCDNLMYTSYWWAGTGNPGSFDCNDSQNLDIQAGNAAAGIDFTLDPAGGVSGRVVDGGGNPLEGIHIYAESQQGGRRLWVSGTNTDSNGDYTLTSLPGGSVYVRACPGCNGYDYVNMWYDADEDTSDLDPVSISTNDIQPGINFTLESGGSIEGFVRDDSGNGIPGVHVYVRSEKCGGIQYSESDTVDQGYYRITGIPAGDVYVYACPECNGQNYVGEWGYYNDQGVNIGTLDCNEAAAVTVNVGQSTPIADFNLSPGATISGVVKDKQGNEITGVSLYVQLQKVTDPCTEYHDFRGVYSNPDDGTYEITGIPDGTYFLKTDNGNSDYVGEWWAATGSLINCQYAQSITIDSGQTLGGNDFHLEKGRYISGNVTDTNNNPISNVWVEATAGPCLNSLVGADTDVNGNYFLGPVPTEGIYVYACPECAGQNYLGEWYDGDSGDRDCHSAVPISKSENIDFILEPGRQLHFMINGDGVEGMDISVHDWHTGEFLQGGRVNSSSVTVNSIPPASQGKYRVYLNSGDTYYMAQTYPDSVDPDQTLIFSPVEGAKIWGDVRGQNGDLLERVCVYASTAQCAPFMDGSGYTDENGGYSFIVPIGTPLYLYADADCNDQINYLSQYWTYSASDYECDKASAIVINAAGTDTNINFTLPRGSTVSGQVLDHNDNPIEGLWVHAFDNACGGNGLGGDRTDSNGEYTIFGIPPGEVYVQTCPSCDNMMYTGYWWTGPGKTGSFDCNAAASPLEDIPPGTDVVGIDFALDPAGGVSGVVKDTAGNGIEGVHVYAETQTPDGRRFWVSGTNTCETGDTDCEKGEYTLTGIPKGTTYIRAVPGAGWPQKDYVNKWYDLSGGTFDYEGAHPVTVQIGSLTAGIDFTLEDAGRIAGYVYEEGTTWGIPNVHIQVKSAACGDSFQYSEGNTDEDGYFYLTGIPEATGEEKVYLYACPECSGQNFLGEWYDEAYGTRECSLAAGVNVDIRKTTTLLTPFSQPPFSQPPFSLSPGMSVSGKVVEYQDPDDPNDPTPVSGLWVHAHDNACGGNWLGGAYTKTDGTYEIFGLPQDVSVYVGTCPQCDNLNFLEAWFDGGDGTRDCSKAEAVTSGVSVDFSLKTGHQISLTIIGDDVEGIDISVHDWVTEEYLHSGRVDSNEFTLSGIPPSSNGQYKVHLNTGGSYYINEMYPNAVSPDDNVEFTPEKGARITGLVTGTDGQGLRNICINAEHPNCGDYIPGTGTYHDGRFEFAVPAPEPSDPGELPTPLFYTLSAHPACNQDEDYFHEYWTADGGVSNCNLAETVEVVWGGETIIDFDLEPGGMTPGDFDADDDVDGRDLAEYLSRIDQANSESNGRTVITLGDLAYHLGMWRRP